VEKVKTKNQGDEMKKLKIQMNGRSDEFGTPKEAIKQSFPCEVLYKEKDLKTIDRLKYELEKAEEDLQQQKFFVNWLKGNIKAEEIKELTQKIKEMK
jgi:hypothetical protein